MSRSAVVIGIGNEYRRDDGIGPALVAELERRALPGVRTAVCDGEPATLLETWHGAELAIVVDAVLCEPSTPGRIRRSQVGSLPGGRGGVSSHAMGVPDALLLGRALDRVPHDLVVFAVEAADLGLGAGLSPAVGAALPGLVDAVLAELGHGQAAPSPAD